MRMVQEGLSYEVWGSLGGVVGWFLMFLCLANDTPFDSDGELPNCSTAASGFFSEWH